MPKRLDDYYEKYDHYLQLKMAGSPKTEEASELTQISRLQRQLQSCFTKVGTGSVFVL